MKLVRWGLLLAALSIAPHGALAQARPPAQKTGPITIFGPGSTGDANGFTITPPGGSAQVTIPEAIASSIASVPSIDIVRSAISSRAMKLPAFSISGFRAKGDRGFGTVFEAATSSVPGAIQDSTGAYFAPKRTGAGPLRAGSFGAYADGTNSDTSAVQTLVAAGQAKGSALRLEAGTYKIDGPGIKLDYSQQTADAGNDPRGLRFMGDGPHNTVIQASDTTGYGLSILGAPTNADVDGVKALVHLPFGNFTVTHGSQPQAQSRGIYAKNAAFLHGSDVLLTNLGEGMRLESVLSSEFDHFQFAFNGIGLRVMKGSGFSNINSVTFNKPVFRLNTGAGIVGDAAVTGMVLNNPQIEANGTMGDLTSGGAYMVFNANQEGGTGLMMNGGYVEGNRGGYDLQLDNVGTQQVVHVLTNVTFNQFSSVNYVKDRIKINGPTKLVLIGCTFKALGDYVPDAGRTIVSYNPAVSEVVSIGSDLGPLVERNGIKNQNELTFRGSLNANGTVASIPAGWTTTKNDTGVYTVKLPFTLDPNLYSVVGISVNGTPVKFERALKTSTSFSLVMTNASNATADGPVDFIFRIGN